MEDKREICNPYEDFASHRGNDVINVNDGTILPEFIQKLQSSVTSLMAKFETSQASVDERDYSVYTGSGGTAMLYYLFYDLMQNGTYLDKAIETVEGALSRLKQSRLSFLNGDVGPLVLGAVFHHKKGSTERSQQLVNKLKLLVPTTLSLQTDLPDEMLYGRAGFLYGLLYLNTHIGPGTIDPSIIEQLISVLLQSGQTLSRQEGLKVPLMYQWHDKHYLGAAHGMAGILYVLLQAREHLTECELQTLIRPTIDYLLGIQFPSGNLPSSLGNATDRLVQWCHGAPGAVQLYCQAYKVYRDERYLRAALGCGEVVWRRGLLSKGYSLCHGVSGNGYTFLELYQTTKDAKHLYRACKFADWCRDYGKFQGCRPDRPMSLFEGLAGVIYFMMDIQRPVVAKFPAYTL